MARELGDVLHYFIPDSSDGASAAPTDPQPAGPGETRGVVVPLGEGDVLRAAFVWNLAVEAARWGVAATVIAARGAGAAPLWPPPGTGPLGTELVLCDATDPGEFARTWRALSEQRGARPAEDRFVIACVPGSWLTEPIDLAPLLPWILLFVTPDPHELQQAYGRAERLMQIAPDARVGVTVHGVSNVADARSTFLGLASAVERKLGRPLASYGLLLDDLHVYRAIVNLRPIGLVQPQSRAARALRDVARLLIEDARADGAP